MNRRKVAGICTLIAMSVAFGTSPAFAMENATNVRTAFEKQERGTVIDSGECGENAAWKLDSSGTLTISGTGEMYDFKTPNSKFSTTTGKNAPWRSTDNGLIKRIVVEEGITRIGNGAFVCAGAEINQIDGFDAVGSLESIVLPSTLKSIGSKSFWNVSCASLDIPESVESLDSEAFQLARIKEISTGISSIGQGTFDQSGVSGLTLKNGVTVIEENAFSGCKNLTQVTMPESLKTIGSRAFASCSKIKEITIPASVTEMGREIFADCTSLQTAVIKAQVSDIGSDCFNGCSDLTAVALPETLKGIASGAFNGCSSLEKVVLPENITFIGAGAFNSCISLKAISLPGKVTDLYSGAFDGCKTLTEITIPASVSNIVTGIGGKANDFSVFDECENLKNIDVENGNKTYQAYDGCLYNADMTELLYCPLGKEEVLLPDSVTAVSNAAFYTKTGKNEHLKEIYFYGKAPEISETGLQCIFAKVYIPAKDDSWTSEKKKNYGGNLTWTEWQPDISQYQVRLSKTGFAYDGTEKKPEVTLSYGEEILNSAAYTVTYSDNIKAGTASVTINGTGKYRGKMVKTFRIYNMPTVNNQQVNRQPQQPQTTTVKTTAKIKLNRTKLTLKKGKTFKLKVTLTPKDSKDKIVYKTSNKKVATVSKTGKIKAKKKGKAKITVISGKKKAVCTVKVK